MTLFLKHINACDDEVRDAKESDGSDDADGDTRRGVIAYRPSPEAHTDSEIKRCSPEHCANSEIDEHLHRDLPIDRRNTSKNINNIINRIGQYLLSDYLMYFTRSALFGDVSMACWSFLGIAAPLSPSTDGAVRAPTYVDVLSAVT